MDRGHLTFCERLAKEECHSRNHGINRGWRGQKDLGLQGKTALVLGGSKGLGRGVADALADEGVAVAVIARGKEALDRAVAEITARGGRAIGLTADTSDWPTIENAAKSARDQLGPIDILLNNSGG